MANFLSAMFYFLTAVSIFVAIPLLHTFFDSDSSRVSRIAACISLMAMCSMLIGLGAAVGF